MTRSPRTARSQRGVAAVELGLLLGVVLLPIVFGITEIGRSMYQYEALTKSARAAARYLAVKDVKAAATLAETRCIAVYGVAVATCDGTDRTPAVPGLTTANVLIATPDTAPGLRNVETGSGAMDIVTVTISPANAPYRFVSIIPWIFPSIDFAPISAAMPHMMPMATVFMNTISEKSGSAGIW